MKEVEKSMEVTSEREVTPKNKRVLSGMRPTGKLHIGHLSVLENWVRMQDQYDCFFFIANWHALTTTFEDTENMGVLIREMALDWLSVGINPEKSPIFVQSQVKEHAELYLLLSMLTPVSWLERCPTYKDQLVQLGSQGRDISTHGFLGYPVLMAADILLYRADFVPVGEDQLPHLELCREIARRFNHLYGVQTFTEPQAQLAKIALLPGIDGRKMSKSYANDIAISASLEEIQNQVRRMVTDPNRIHKTDPGDPNICTVFTYQKWFNPTESSQISLDCQKGEIGCVACKKRLAAQLNAYLAPYREKRQYYAEDPKKVDEILFHGAQKARKSAEEMLREIRQVMQMED